MGLKLLAETHKNNLDAEDSVLLNVDQQVPYFKDETYFKPILQPEERTRRKNPDIKMQFETSYPDDLIEQEAYEQTYTLN